jgi:hypothetical protein
MKCVDSAISREQLDRGGWRRKNREKEGGGKDKEKRGERNQVNEEIKDEWKD